jgi:WD40 repeat protein
MKSGDILVWTGLEALLSEDAPQPAQLIGPGFRISSPIRTTTDPASRGTSSSHDVMAVYLDHSVSSKHLILVAYTNDPYFYRLHVDLQSNSVEWTPFGEEPFGSITAVKPSFSDQEAESSFVIVGDQLGCISIYDWNASPSSESLRPSSVHALRKFEAHEDGAVTAIAWNSITLVSGSSRGTIKIWDSLSFSSLRSFPSPGARPPTGGEWDSVGQLVLARDLLIVSVGSRVMAWRAGPVGNRGQSIWKGKHKKLKKGTAAKGHRE